MFQWIRMPFCLTGAAYSVLAAMFYLLNRHNVFTTACDYSFFSS